ncbi:MAG: nucleotide sugar dehydrogenase [Thaumarchaeota archaeon]|nr:nucleotide sugar dehydrogenase [Nitrososphaerota archaeon]
MLSETLSDSQNKKTMIEVLGLGYIGLPLAIRLAATGWKVTGMDINQDRVRRLERNNLMESELHLKKEFLECRNNKSLSFSTEPQKSTNSKIGIICVPTPIPKSDVKSDVFVRAAVEKFLDTSNEGCVIIIESSIEVGTTDEMKKIIESKGFVIGENFGLAFCPERIDPQNKKWRLENIPRVIYCSDDTTFKIAQNVYSNVNNSNLIRVKSAKVAEVVKSFENTFRLVNISLVNELAMLCDKLGINVTDVINAAATKPFGFVPFYTGAGAGGHCIPKDPRFLLESAKKTGTTFHLIENAIKINENIPKYIVDSIEKTLVELKLEKSVLVCGLSYKPNIDDMRDSPGFRIATEFHKKGFNVVAYDPHFKPELLNKYLKENHLTSLDFSVIMNLDTNSLQNFSCLCIVQHHDKAKSQISEIYKDSVIPMIYDCQNNMKYDPKSTSILKHFGS